MPEELEAEYRALTHGQILPVGARVLLSLQEPDAAAPSTHFSAEKLDTGWKYQVLDARGSVEPTDTTLCLRCHAEGRTDGLFGIPVQL